MRALGGIVATLIILSGCGGKTSVRKDCPCGFYTTSSGKMLHWNDGEKITFSFQKDFPKDLRPSVSAAAHNYNRLFRNTRLTLDPELELAPVMKNLDPQSVSGDGVNGVYWVPEPWPWKDKDPNSDAMTVVLFEKNRIVEADVFFRSRSFDGPVTFPNESLYSSIIGDGNSLLTEAGAGLSTEPSEITKGSSANVRWAYVIGVHEFGHALGRVHAHQEDSIMHATVGLDSLQHPFSSFDLDSFSKAYELNGSGAIKDLAHNSDH